MGDSNPLDLYEKAITKIKSGSEPFYASWLNFGLHSARS